MFTETDYHFDEVIERRGTHSMKWLSPGADPSVDLSEALLPMWVADMDFRTAPPILEALQKEISHGIFGYRQTPDRYTEAVLNWQKKHFDWQAHPQWLVPMPGVISAINIAIQAFSLPGDHILIQPPVYHHFFHDVISNGRRVAEAPLVEENGVYHFDPAIFKAAIRPNTRLFILCNPHNPTGNVWSREDLLTMATICQEHGILVISDEIHQDLVFDKTARHIAWGTLGDEIANNAIICTAPSKTFNLAGLQCANIFIPNKHLRQIYTEQRNRCGLFLTNTMGSIACEAAYRDGEPWLNAALQYIHDNHVYLVEEIRKRNLPFNVTPTKALYLAWIDFRQLNLPAEELNQRLHRARLWLDDGRKFGTQGHGFMRINLACPRAFVTKALERLEQFWT